MVSFDASEIVNWSDMPDAHHQLPALVRQLAQATAKVSDIDMPSGSSVRLGGWDGLVIATDGRPWVPEGHSGWEISCNKDPRAKATSDYDKRTEDPLGVEVTNTTFVFVTSRRWPGKREWARTRREAGPWADVRAFDADDLVAWLEQAPEVARWFTRVIGNGSTAIEDILEVMKLQAERHTEITQGFQQLHAGFVDLRADIGTAFSPTPAALGEPAEPERYSDSAWRALAEKVDVARDLIGKNMVRSAQVVLEQIRNEAEPIPAELEFRIATNLAVCALADDDFERARAFLEEAHRLQPKTSKAIANAALAAQLGKEPERAILLATQARALETETSQATAILMQALWETGHPEQLDEMLTSEEWITRDRDCVSVLASIRQQQSRFDDATELYQFLTEGNPEDAYAHLALSQCLLRHSQTDYGRGHHAEDIFTRLRKAACVATRAIELFRTTELKTQLQTALTARACAHALLNQHAEATADLDEVLTASPNHPVAAYNKGLLLQLQGRRAEARNLLESIQDPARYPDVALPLAESYLGDGDGRAAIRLMKGTFQLEHPEWQDVHRAGVLCRAEAVENMACSVSRLLEIALGQEPENPRLLALNGTCLGIHGSPAESEEALLKALERADDPDRTHILAWLGFHYQDLSRFSEAADCFAKVASGSASHPLAVTLMICLANSKRLREALRWTRDIQETQHPAPRMALEIEAWVLGHIGDVNAAVVCYQKLCRHPDATPADKLVLAMAQARCGDRAAALETTQGIDITEFPDDPQSLLKLAQIKWILGAEDYLEDAYRARRQGASYPDIHIGYVHLLLSREKDMTEPTVIGPGCAVLLRGEGTETWWRILDYGEEPRDDHEVGPDDDLAGLLQGKHVGESIVLPRLIEDRRYEVAVIQSKFVRAFQETVAAFPTRFPENTSLSTFMVEDDDLTDLFEITDRRTRTVRIAWDMYLNGRLPLATFASFVGRSTLEVWRAYAGQPSGQIRFGTGTTEEASQSGAILQATDNVVLDMVALLTVQELGIGEHLRRRFQRVTIPQHVVDELHVTLFDTEETVPAGYLGSDGEGHGIMTEVSEGAWKEWIEYIRSVLELAESFERTASYHLLDADDSPQLFETLTQAGAGAVFAGSEQPVAELLLISDDLALSSVARSFGIDAVNTQAVLEELQRSDVITDDEYSSMVGRLAQLNYWFVRVGADDILRSLEASGYATTEASRAMFKTLQGPYCDAGSAVSVVADVVIGLADKATYEQLELILSMAMAALRHDRVARPILLQFRDRIASGLALSPGARAQILQTLDVYIHTSSIMV